MSATFNENVEMSLLSCLFKDGSLFPVVEDVLEKKMFGSPILGAIYQSIVDVVSNDLYPDSVTVLTDIDRRGILDQIIISSIGVSGKKALDFIGSMDVKKENIESYAYQISDLYANRQLLQLAKDIEDYVANGKPPIENLSHIDLQTGKISGYIGSQTKSIRNAKDVAEKSVELFQEALDGKDLYISTNLKAWDDFTGGLFPGRLYMISAYSNDGKTSLALDIIKNIAIDKKIKTFLATFESGAEEIHNKFVQIMTGISTLNIEKGKLLPDEKLPFSDATKKISSSPIIYEDSSGLSIALLRTKVRKACSEGAKLVVIDQLEQLTIHASENMPEHIRLNYMSYRVKAIARENGIPIILLHQTNKSADSGVNRGKNVDPQIQDVTSGGATACNGIVIIRHKREKQKILETALHWVKNREGMKGMRKVKFEGNKILFRDLTKEEMNSDEPEFTKGG
jgi:replicative DNA helicase